jgi:hypothetical protein
VSLLGRDLLSPLQAQILLPQEDYLCCPLLQEQVVLMVWNDGMTAVQAKMALLLQIRLRDPSQFPHQKQYPLKPKGSQSFLPIISSL